MKTQTDDEVDDLATLEVLDEVRKFTIYTYTKQNTYMRLKPKGNSPLE